MKPQLPACKVKMPAKVRNTLTDIITKKQCANPDAVRRLLTDPRMQVVYRELIKKERENYKPTSKYRHVGNLQFCDREDQIIWFLGGAVTLWQYGRSYTLKEIESARKDLSTLEGLFKGTFLHSIINETLPRIQQQIAAMEWNVAVPGSREPELSRYLAALAADAKDVFGKCLYKITAIVASVVLGSDITDKKVRTAVEMLGTDKKVKLFRIADIKGN